MFLTAFRDAILFVVFLVASIGVPGLAWLYSDWKHHRGWFNDRT